MSAVNLRRLWTALGGPLGLALVVMAAAIGVTWASGRLDYRTRAAQALLTDLKAFPDDNPTNSVLKLQAAKAVDHRAERWQKLDFLQRLEWGTCDWRFSLLRQSSSSVLQVGLVLSDDLTIDKIAEGQGTSEPFDLFWPRWPVLGRALRELRAEGAAAVGFDWLLQELQREAGRREYDDLFAQELRQPGAPAILAIAPEQIPAPLFQYRAAGVGDVSATKDADSVTRRVRAYTDFKQFNPRLGFLAHTNNWILWKETNNSAIWLQTTNAGDAGRKILANEAGNVIVPVGKRAAITQTVPLMVTNRVWHLGLVLAARLLRVDLSRSGIEQHELQLRQTNGIVVRRIPVDDFGYFQINWSTDLKTIVDWSDHIDYRVEKGLAYENLLALLQRDQLRSAGVAIAITNTFWTNQLVIIGSTATANNLSDRGPTPLGSSDFLVGTHLNVAEMALNDTSLHSLDFGWIALVMAGLAGCASAITWKLRGLWSPLAILVLGGVWVAFAVWSFTEYRLVLPIAHPLVAGLLFPYGAMVSARATFEQRERRRIRAVFAKMVSPDIVHEMLNTGQVELRGVRRELSVFFADVRGFTALTDRTQVEAEQHVQTLGLTGAAAEAHFDARAHEVLDTVNLYLGGLADVVKFHQGTLDKYIGDCVMAFWGAPTPNARHAVNSVIAAVDSQRMIARLNDVRSRENDRRTTANVARLSRGKTAWPMLPVLALGTGVNTGMVTVGLMGSDAHIVNYTVFGREVNLASRLEGVSGHARIVIGEATFRALEQHAPPLANVCRPLEPVAVKGFRAPVIVYEVRWQEADAAAIQSLALYEATPSPAFKPLVEESANS